MIKLPEASLLQCCGSSAWAREMAAHSFPNAKEVFATGDSIWQSLGPDDWKEAFHAHPRIGERATSDWTREEQAAARHASEEVHSQLRDLNRRYEERFGFIFIICANGRGAHAILDALRSRLDNDPDTELKTAAEEQRQITHLRLKRLLPQPK